MNKKTWLEILRENFLHQRGGKLISTEAFFLAVISYIVMALVYNVPAMVSFLLAVMVGFIFPILVGIYKTFAWIIAVLFSIMWALFAFILLAAIAKGDVIVGGIGGIIVFLISFFVHKKYSGLSFKKNSLGNVNNQIEMNYEGVAYEKVLFCSKCGKRIKNANGRCDTCDK